MCISLFQTLLKPEGFYFSVCLSLCLACFRDLVSLCSPGSPRNHSVEQASLQLRQPTASAS